MKGTDAFKATIETHLQRIASTDPLFAETLNKPDKNLEDCITYILNTVQKSGCNGFADEEIFGMAVHYYDEDKIEIGKPIAGKVVVNHHVELTPEEIAKAKQDALNKVIEDKKKKLTSKPAKKKDSAAEATRYSLFD